MVVCTFGETVSYCGSCDVEFAVVNVYLSSFLGDNDLSSVLSVSVVVEWLCHGMPCRWVRVRISDVFILSERRTFCYLPNLVAQRNSYLVSLFWALYI